MPLYDYQCRNCGKTFEQLRRMEDADAKTRCPECHSEDVERRLSTFATSGCGASRSSRFR